MKKITIGVPTYHAHSTLPKLLSSLQTQTMSGDIAIILANDDPKDNGTYKNRFFICKFITFFIPIKKKEVG